MSLKALFKRVSLGLQFVHFSIPSYLVLFCNMLMKIINNDSDKDQPGMTYYVLFITAEYDRHFFVSETSIWFIFKVK